MPGNAFIRFKKYDGKFAPGESLQKNYEGDKGWIEIGEWGWDIEAEASHLKGTGAAVGKPQPGVFSFSHYYDKSSPVLMAFIVQGQHFQEVTLDMLKQTGDKLPTLFFRMSCKDVFISKVSSKGGEDGSVSQDVEFVFKQVSMGYKPQKNDGGLGALKNFDWNIATMVDKTDVKVSF